MRNYSHEYVPDYPPEEPVAERKSRVLIVCLVALAVCVVLVIVSLATIDAMKTEIEAYRAETAELYDKAAHFAEIAETNDRLMKENSGLSDEIAELRDENRRIAVENIAMEAEIDILVTANDELELLHGEQLEKIRWIEDAEKRPQPEEDFKITFYSTTAVFSHLVPNETVAMNSQQVADLGLRHGDEIYVKSNRGWSGFYRITDSGCAYGTIDIYIDYKDLPHWGVEYGVKILI